MHLIKSVIILAHGYVDVERGFSTNALLITPPKASVSPASIVALRTIKDTLCTVGSNLLRVPITRAAMSCSKCSCLFYSKKEDEARKLELEVNQFSYKLFV